MAGVTGGTGREKQPRAYVREFTVRRKDLEALDRLPTEGELYPPDSSSSHCSAAPPEPQRRARAEKYGRVRTRRATRDSRRTPP